MEQISLNEIDGIKIGHAEDLKAGTGCTVIISENGAIAGVDVRGGAPGTRETDLLNPVNLVDKIHAVLLTGGSAFGLDAAAGVMQYLEKRETGFDVGVTHVPIVCGAALFDLTVGDHKIRPDKEMGYTACTNAGNTNQLNGCIGAGTGAAVGKISGIEKAMKSGLGSFAVQTGELKVGAVVAVNCLGNVVDPATGISIAGPLNDDLNTIGDTEKIMAESYNNILNLFSGNTTIGAIITNADFTKAEATKLASMTHNGFARTIRPAHTMYDGDTIFTLATGEVKADLTTAGALAANVMAEAVVEAVKSAESIHGLKSYHELFNNLL